MDFEEVDVLTVLLQDILDEKYVRTEIVVTDGEWYQVRVRSETGISCLSKKRFALRSLAIDHADFIIDRISYLIEEFGYTHKPISNN